MHKTSALGLAAASVLALAACTGGGTGQSPSPTAITTSAAADKVYTEGELRELIAGTQDGEGNELKLYSQEQVAQGSNIANLLMRTAKVEPADCKSIATAGLLDKVDDGDVAVALSESSQPRTLSARSGSKGPDAVGLLKEVSGKMGQCANFSVEALGQRYEVSSKELQADTNAKETFATVSKRSTGEMLMQVSGAEGRLLVVATKGGSDLADDDQKELEDLVNEVLAKADGGSATASAPPTGTSTRTTSPTSTPTPTQTESRMSPAPTVTVTATPTP
ncbi:hypothetical protein ACS5PJ_18245 [Pseudarthrobacter sp. YS3]|uniref:hypothetical protein n=1 Tax=Pseudarthrobacter sp. YS3 TaxID=3453718 RepID=UPI003EEB8C46